MPKSNVLDLSTFLNMLLRDCNWSLKEHGRSTEIFPVSISGTAQDRGGSLFVVGSGGGGGPGKELLLTEVGGDISKFSGEKAETGRCVEVQGILGFIADIVDSGLLDGLLGSVADLFLLCKYFLRTSNGLNDFGNNPRCWKSFFSIAPTKR